MSSIDKLSDNSAFFRNSNLQLNTYRYPDIYGTFSPPYPIPVVLQKRAHLWAHLCIGETCVTLVILPISTPSQYTWGSQAKVLQRGPVSCLSLWLLWHAKVPRDLTNRAAVHPCESKFMGGQWETWLNYSFKVCGAVFGAALVGCLPIWPITNVRVRLE